MYTWVPQLNYSRQNEQQEEKEMSTWYTETNTKIGDNVVLNELTTEDAVVCTFKKNNGHVEEVVVPELKRVILKEEFYMGKKTMYTLYMEEHRVNAKDKDGNIVSSSEIDEWTGYAIANEEDFRSTVFRLQDICSTR